jgi:lysophospholipase L1-like esterase
MQSRKPNLVIFSIGLNDSALITPRMEPRVSIDKFNQNIATLYKKARELDARVVFIGPTTVVENKTTPIPWDTTKHYTVASALAFDNLLKKFCDRNKINFISLTSTLGTDDIAGDGLHPNTSGHEKIYIKIKPHLEKIILDLAS